MSTGKTYSTKYLLDSNNNRGAEGQVLSTTSTGIDWVDANTVPGTGLWLANGNDIYNSNSGNVGIGVTGPGAKLDVRGTGNFLGTAATGAPLVTIENNSGSTATSYGLLVKGGGNSSSGKTFEVRDDSGNTDLIVKGNGNVGIGTTSPATKLDLGSTQGGGMQFLYDTTQAYRHQILNYWNSGTDSRMDFNIGRTANVAPVTVMSVGYGGNVGIGTVTPDYKLDIEGTSPRIRVKETSSNTSTTMVEVENSDGRGAMLGIGGSGRTDIIANRGYINAQSETDGLAIGTEGTDPILFYTQGVATSNERMRITSTGDVGIGEDNPTSLLHLKKASGDPMLNIQAVSAGDPGITFTSINNRTGNIFYSDGTTNAKLTYDHADTSFKLYAHNTSVADFVLNETTSYFPTQNVGIGLTPNASYSNLQIKTPSSAYGLDLVGRDAGSSSESQITFWNSNQTSVLAAIVNSSDSLLFYTGTTERMRITSVGELQVTGNGVIKNEHSSANYSYWQQTSSDARLFTQYAQPLYFGTNASTKMTILSSGNVGIGTTNPGAKFVVTDNNNGQDTTFKVNHTRSNSDVATQAIEVSMSLSGADTTTFDRINSGILVDVVSTADGDTSNEHRLYGVYSDVTYSGMSDLVRGGYFKAESNNNTEKTAQTIGIYGQAVHDASSANGGVTTLAGVYGVASLQDTGDVTNTYGGFFLADIPDTRDTDVNVVKGVEGHIDINKATAISYGNMSAVSAVIDNNEGAVPNFSDQYLFKGDYQGDKGSNAYGVYCEGDKHYLQGSVGIGILNPAQPLHVSGNARVTGAYYDSNNSPGAVNQVLVSTVTGTDWVDASGSSIIGGPYLPLAGGTMTGAITMNDNVPINFGTGGSTDSRIFYDALDLNIESQGGKIFIVKDVTDLSTGIVLDSSSNVAIGAAGGASASGAKLTVTGNTYVSGTVQVPDNGKLAAGSSLDLQIYHDGSNSYINETGTGSLVLKTSALLVRNPSDASMLDAQSGGAINLYYNGYKKFETTSTGVAVTSTSSAFSSGAGANGDCTVIIEADTDNANENSNPVLKLQQDGGGAFGHFGLNGNPNDTFSGATVNSAYLRASTDLQFVAGSTVLAATILANGRFGIGTTTATEVLEVQGSAANISISNTSENDSGLIFKDAQDPTGQAAAIKFGSGDNKLKFYVNDDAAQRMVIDTNGNVGIGSGSPGCKFEVNDGGGNNQIRLTRSGSTRVELSTNANEGELSLYRSNNIATVYISSYYDSYFNGGNVGIGTTAPGNKLHVHETSTVGGKWEVAKFEGDIGVGGGITLSSSSSGAEWSLIAQGASGGALANNLGFHLTDAGTSGGALGYKMTLEASSGNVGIGITTPQAPLSFASVVGSKIDFYHNTTSSDRYGIEVQSSELRIHSGAQGSNTGGITFGKKTTSTFTEAMRITNAGNVGIGVTNPLQKLSVHGNIELVGEDVGNCGVRYIKYNCPDDASYNVLGLTTSTANFITKVGINKTSPAVKLDVSDSIAGSGFTNGLARFENTIETSTGGAGVLNIANNYQGGFGTLIKFWFEESSVATINFNSSTNAVVYNTTSDYRLKEDLQQFDGLEIVDKIKTYNYKWKKADARGYGALAHELQEVFPDAVTGEKDGEDMQGVDYSTLVPVLIKSIQELKAEIELLKQQINN